MQVAKQEAPRVYIGQIHSFTLPSGRKVTARETNGNDDELLSKAEGAANGENIIAYIADVCQSDSELQDGKPTSEDVLKWPVNDKHYFMFKVRIINQGPKVEFEHECLNPNCFQDIDNQIRTKTTYEENIEKEFDNNLSLPDEELIKSPGRVKKYPGGLKEIIDFKTSSQRHFRFKILNGELEKKQLAVSPGSVSHNTKLYLRELEMFEDGKWVLVTNFHQIPSREMSEIRAQIAKWDVEFDPAVVLICPKCKNKVDYPLFAMPTFFFPVPQI